MIGGGAQSDGMLDGAEPSLPAVHALHLAEVLARWDVSADALLAPLGLSADGLAEPGARLPLATIERLVDRARALSGEPGLGLHLGSRMRISAHGHLGFAAMTARNVREALELAVRFAPTRTTAIALHLREDGAAASLVIEERAPLGSARDVVVLALVTGIYEIGKALTGRDLTGSVELAFPEPAYFARFAGVAPGPVRFDRPANRLVFDSAILDLPLAMADRAALRLAREHCERELEALGADGDLVARVRALVFRDGGGVRTLEEVARALHVSPRTLKRRLAAQSTAYSTLLDEERREHAILLLRADELSMDEIAERLGYSDAANFTRAFRRWTGRTPGELRRARSPKPG